jgi:hypothetical protein
MTEDKVSTGMHLSSGELKILKNFGRENLVDLDDTDSPQP